MLLKHSQLVGKIKWVSESEFRTNCIFCPDTKQHLYVNINLGVFHCFKCGMSGKYTTNDIVEKPKIKKYSNEQVDVSSLQLQYLYDRGLSIDDILLYAPISFQKYPTYIFSNRESLKIGRSIFNQEPKYVKLGESLYPWGTSLYDIESESVTLVEGVFDYIAVRNYAKQPALALLGKTLSQTYKSFLLSLPVKRVFILLDNDAKDYAMLIYNSLKFWKKIEVLYTDDDPWVNRFELQKLY